METIFRKHLFEVQLDFFVLLNGLLGEDEVYDLFCTQPPDGNQNVKASLFKMCIFLDSNMFLPIKSTKAKHI